jgi:uncharacterized membrane protein
MKQQTTKQKTIKIAMTGIAAAIIFAVTFFMRIPVPLPGGAYINLGDSAIFLIAFLTTGRAVCSPRSQLNSVQNVPRDTPADACLPAAIGAAIGSAFADLAAGAPLYIPATFIIKGAMGFLFGKLTDKSKSFGHFIAAAAICGAVMICGYFLYEAAVFSLSYAVTSMPFNLIQAAGSVLVAAAVYKPAVNIKLKL